MKPTAAASPTERPVLLCLSHLRWDFVYQRPQHLMSRAAATHRVVYFEEPVFSADAREPSLDLRHSTEGVLLATPVLAEGLDAATVDAAQRALLDGLLKTLAAPVSVAWYYTPLALDYAGHVAADVTVFDSMDELSLFRDASPRLLLSERRLLRRADVVFCGGPSLYEAKRRMHPNAHLFASSVDAAHFGQARGYVGPEPADQASVAKPRVGFFGVIDERLDAELLGAVAAARPDWQFVVLGPVVKIDPASLPRRPNLHWLGMKSYAELPAYLAGWDAGLMPFAMNDATRFISPTKTPEFLAAGVPLVSTPIADVVSEWGKGGLVRIADDAESVVEALEAVLDRPRSAWLAQVDRRLSWMSWDATWGRMRDLIAGTAAGTRPRVTSVEGPTHA